MPKTPSPAGPLVLTLDIGTSSVRAMIWDRNGDWVPGWEAEIEHRMTLTADGGVEADARALWRRTVRCIDSVLEKAERQATLIGAVGISTFWHSLMGVNGEGKPLTPVYTWADLRSQSAAQELKQRLDEQAIHARTGCMLHSSYLPAKLLWLSQSQAETFHAVESWMSFGEYCFLQLFGETAVSISMASGTGLLNQDTCTWDSALLEVLPVTVGQLSRLVDADTAFTHLHKKWTKRWPALKNVSWYPALGDGACSNAGSNCVTRERMALMIGTSGALRVLWAANGVATPSGLWRYRLDREHIIVGGALSNGGNLVRWLRETLQIGKRSDMARQIASLPPDGHGLTVLPFLAGERNPDYRADLRATIQGLGLATTPYEIAQAGLEAVSYRCALIHDLLARVAPEAETLVVNGGAILHRPYWMQITADVLGRPLIVSSEAEATSRGAALMALRSLGELASIEAAQDRLGDCFSPDLERHAIYQRGAQRQQRLYDLLQDFSAEAAPAVTPAVAKPGQAAALGEEGGNTQMEAESALVPGADGV